jgi:predicted ArsR family transcriptional regulator
MTTSQEQVLDYIRNHRLVTAGEISLALNMTEANARHHLTILEKIGAIQLTGHRSQPGKGRPSNIYSLSQKNQGHNLEGLSIALWDEMLSAFPGDEREVLFERLATRLAGQSVMGRQADNLTVRLLKGVECLNNMQYEARWEAFAGGPHIIFQHCPYRGILNNHPELCLLDQALLRKILGVNVEQIACLISQPDGGHACIFKIKP